MNELQNRKAFQGRAWYTVFLNALVGCSIGSTFPQFTMTVGALAQKSGIPESILLTSDTVKACGIVVSMLISGLMYNRFGAKKIFIYATVVTVVPQILFLYTEQIWLLMILKFIQGSSSVIFPIFIVVILEWIDEKNVGVATALFNGIFYSGGGIGGTFAGFMIARSGWESSYYAMVVVQLVLGILWLLTIKERHPHNDRVPQKTKEETKPKKNLLLTAEVWLLAISLLATTWTVQAITVDMPLFAGMLGFNEIETGKILTAVTIGIIVACLLSGKVSDFFTCKSERKDISRILVLMIGYVIIILASIFVFAMDMNNFTTLYIFALLMTFGGAWGLGSFYCILPEIYDEKSVPVVTGITGGIGDAGMPLAPLVVGVVFGIRGMWEIGWGSCALIALISAATAVVLITIQKKKQVPV